MTAAVASFVGVREYLLLNRRKKKRLETHLYEKKHEALAYNEKHKHEIGVRNKKARLGQHTALHLARYVGITVDEAVE